MSRIDSPWGDFERSHGRLRLRLATPVTQPCVEMGRLVTAHARRKRAALWVLAGLLAVLAVVLALGCAGQ